MIQPLYTYSPLKKGKQRYVQRPCTGVLRNCICNGQKVETSPMSLPDEWLNCAIQRLEYCPTVKKKVWAVDTHNSMDESQFC